MPRMLDYEERGSRANFGRQGKSLNTCETGVAVEAACRVQGRNWTRSGNGGPGPARNPSFPQTRRH